jgi:hypothetical protein
MSSDSITAGVREEKEMASTIEWLEITAVLGILALAVIVLLVTRSRHKSAKSPSPSEEEAEKVSKPSAMPQATPPPVYTTVSREDVQKAEEDLRILSIEKEIASYALTRLYEAQAEGKITEKDREKLLGKYKDEMNALEKRINDKQMVVRLHELETTQADLIKLFQEKFDEINRNIENIRSTLGIVSKPPQKEPEPKKEETSPKEKSKEAEEAEEAKEKAPPRPRSPPKSKAEEKVEAIQQEVLKILERLEKQEAEG